MINKKEWKHKKDDILYNTREARLRLGRNGGVLIGITCLSGRGQRPATECVPSVREDTWLAAGTSNPHSDPTLPPPL